MDNAIIITICGLLLLAYFFDLTSAKTKVPSVILLLLLGWGIKQASNLLYLHIPNLDPILPLFGTVGLILIVLEGSLELNLDRSRLVLVGKSSVMAFLPMVFISCILGYAFQYFGQTTFKVGLVNAIPLSIISSAIAIPSVRSFLSKDKEFVTYESSLSDIFGVMAFNFIVQNDSFGFNLFGIFALQLLLIILISLVATIGLTFLLKHLRHHVKFTPIILLVVLIYAISKYLHLPALLFILLFGLILGNLNKLKHFYVVKLIHTETLGVEVHRFKGLVTEMTFLIRSMFFLLFGFLMETSDILNLNSLIWAGGIIIGIFIVRWFFLKIVRMPSTPLLYIAPRGLITVLLFLSVPPNSMLAIANKSLVIQVIILTALIMMYGLVKNDVVPHTQAQPTLVDSSVDTTQS